MTATQMAYLSLCKLKQKWLPVSPFMFKKKKRKKSFQSKWRSGSKPVSPPLPAVFGDGGLRILPGKVIRIEIMTVQSHETHNANKVEKRRMY